jgi:UDP-glucose 4-epimerase
MKVAVTGAAGYVGAALVRRLLETGHSVAALARGPLLFPPRAGLEITQGDVRDPRALDSLARDGDAVAHLAAYVHRPAASPAEVRECFAVNVEGTRALLAAIERAGRRPRLVFVSTISVYGAAFENVREDAACAPDTPYGASKLAAEQLVRDALARGVVQGMVLRPAVVFGPGAPGNVERMRRFLERGLWPQLAGGSNRKSLVHVDDLVEVVTLALARGAPESVYNVAAAPPLTMRGIAEALAGGRRVWRLPVPGAIASGAARALMLAGKFGARPLAELARTLDTFGASTTVDTALLSRDFQVRFRASEPALRSLAAGR